MFLKDLGKKVRRGQAGNIRAGKHAGGSAYGYRSIVGKPGESQIHEPEACIVRRIFAEYVSGKRPRQIIERLNREKIKPPRGQYWQPGALTGSNNRHSGILGNEIYSGERVWNKVRMLKNPETGKRISRPNPENEWHRATVPSLRIISDEMFKTATSIRKGRSALAPVLRRNPKRILSGLLRCATCGGGMSIKGNDRGGTRVICTRFHNAGLCENNRTYYLHHIEDLVLSGLRKHLVNPKAIQHFLKSYQEERKRLLKAADSLRPSLERQLSETTRRIARLTDAMIDSDAPVSQFTSKIAELERDRLALQSRLDDLSKPVQTIALHPAVQERYLTLVNDLTTALRDGEPADEITDVIRDLIESVVVERTRSGEPIKLRVNGRLSALIGEPVFPESSLSGLSGPRHR